MENVDPRTLGNQEGKEAAMTDTYEPPKVWTWDAESGGRFASINRPIIKLINDFIHTSFFFGQWATFLQINSPIYSDSFSLHRTWHRLHRTWHRLGLF